MIEGLYYTGFFVGWYLLCVFAVDYTFRSLRKNVWLYGAYAAFSPVAVILLCAMLGIRV